MTKEEEKVPALTKKHGRSIGLDFGALSPKLSEQLKEQRFVLEGADLKQFDADSDAIVRLHIRGSSTSRSAVRPRPARPRASATSCR